MADRGPPPAPRPVPLCAFPECSAAGSFGFRGPGIANLAHRNPDAIEVWTCGAHQAEGPQLLRLKIEAAGLARANALALAARRAEGKLL
jgi:hypothetical protein